MGGKDEQKKKDYLIAKALHKFMWASILASLASQIAMTTDAIVVSQFIGPEAISAINLTMPVTLWLMYLALPDEPGFAFGLAAAALWPGSLAGYLVSLSGMWLWLCVIICFSIGTVSILYSLKRIKQGGSCNE